MNADVARGLRVRRARWRRQGVEKSVIVVGRWGIVMAGRLP